MNKLVNDFCNNIQTQGFSEVKIKFSDEEFSERAFIKPDSPVLYYVSICDDNLNDFNNYTAKKANFSENMYGALKTTLSIVRCKSVVCVNIIVTDNMNSEKSEFLKSCEIYPETGRYNVWWIYDTSENKLYTGNNHPDKVIGIEDILFYSAGIKSQKLKEVKEAQGNNKIPFTLSICFINIIIFAVMMIIGKRDEFIQLFGNSQYYILEYKEFYRLFSCMFIHADIFHIIENMISLYIFGGMTERFYGSFDTALVYFFSGAVGSLISFAFGTGISVGASGAIFGLIACILYTSKVNKKSVEGINYATMLIIAILNIASGFMISEVDNFGHIGGFLAGLIVSKIVYKVK